MGYIYGKYNNGPYFLSHTFSSLLFGCIPYPGNECSVDVDSFHTCCVKRLCKLDRKVSRIATNVQHLINSGGRGERERKERMVSLLQRNRILKKRRQKESGRITARAMEMNRDAGCVKQRDKDEKERKEK